MDNEKTMYVAFTVHGDLTPLTLAEAILNDSYMRSTWTTNDISELAGYFEVYVRHHLNKGEQNG